MQITSALYWAVNRIYWSHVMGLDHSCLGAICCIWYWELSPHTPHTPLASATNGQCCHKDSTKVLKYKYKYSGLKSTLSTST